MSIKLCRAALLLFLCNVLTLCPRKSSAQNNLGDTSVLHIQHSVTTSKTGFPQFL